MAWEKPKDFDELCLKALLVYGPPPAKGWETKSAYPRRPESKAYRKQVIGFFKVWLTGSELGVGWTPLYRDNYVRMLTNNYIRWARSYRHEAEDRGVSGSSGGVRGGTADGAGAI